MSLCQLYPYQKRSFVGMFLQRQEDSWHVPRADFAGVTWHLDAALLPLALLPKQASVLAPLTLKQRCLN